MRDVYGRNINGQSSYMLLKWRVHKGPKWTDLNSIFHYYNRPLFSQIRFKLAVSWLNQQYSIILTSDRITNQSLLPDLFNSQTKIASLLIIYTFSQKIPFKLLEVFSGNSTKKLEISVLKVCDSTTMKH